MAKSSFETINCFTKKESRRFRLLLKKTKIAPNCRYIPNSEKYCTPTEEEMQNYKEQIKAFKKAKAKKESKDANK